MFNTLLQISGKQKSGLRIGSLYLRRATFGAQPRVAKNTDQYKDQLYQAGELQRTRFAGVDRSQFKYSAKIPDFSDQVLANSKIFKSEAQITEKHLKEKHPLEYMVAPRRAQENVYARLEENDLLLTNFPISLKVDEKYISTLVQKQDSNAVINNITIQHSPFEEGRVLHVVVSFDTQKQMKAVKRGLRKYWIQDKLLKMKTKSDRFNEEQKNRTLVVSGLQSHATVQDLVNHFGKFGAITMVEAPTVDTFVQAQMKEKGLLKDYYTQIKEQRQEEEYRHALKQVETEQVIDQNMSKILADAYGKETAQKVLDQQSTFSEKYSKFDLMNDEHYNSFIRTMSTLQSEGIQIENSKSAVNNLIKSVSAEGADAASSAGLPKEAIQENKEQIERTLTYLVKNQENLDSTQKQFLELFQGDEVVATSKTITDPLHSLQRMSIAELSNSYDFLLEILKARELLIKKRIKETLDHHGKTERVLYQSNDYSQEQEEITTAFESIYKGDFSPIDKYLSLNEQLSTIKDSKSITPEEKLYLYMTEQIDYHSERNFGYGSLAQGKTTEFDTNRHLKFHMRGLTKTHMKELPNLHHVYSDEMLKQIQREVQQFRNNMDTPYDELYHKERRLVADIIKAQMAIDDLQKEQKNPAHFMLFNPKDIDAHPKFGNLYDEGDPQFLKDKRLQEKLSNLKHLNISKYSESVQSDRSAVHAYNQIEAQTLETMVATGQMKRSDYELAKQQAIEKNQASMGYAMVTFSHADELEQLLLLSRGLTYMDHAKLQLQKKGIFDHSEFDQQYFYRRMKNESALADQREDLRKAKKELRDFEDNFEKEMPQMLKLKEFRGFAQEMIEDPKYKTRRHVNQRRSKREQEELKNKLKQFQKENPDMDVSSLFNSEASDALRMQAHKAQFQQFKKYAFLKAGLKDPRDDIKKMDKYDLIQAKMNKQHEIFEKFKYPGLKDSQARVMNDGVQTRVNPFTKKLNHRGRKFRYTDEDFLEAYLGKDYTAQIDLNDDEYNQTFGFQERMKDWFPDTNEFLKVPKIKENKKRLQDFMGATMVDGQFGDEAFMKLLASDAPNQLILDLLQGDEDLKHPTQEGRTFFKDFNDLINSRTEAAMDENKIGRENRAQVAKSFIDLKKEYTQGYENSENSFIKTAFGVDVEADLKSLKEDMRPKKFDADAESEDGENGDMEELDDNHPMVQRINQITDYNPELELEALNKDEAEFREFREQHNQLTIEDVLDGLHDAEVTQDGQIIEHAEDEDMAEDDGYGMKEESPYDYDHQLFDEEESGSEEEEFEGRSRYNPVPPKPKNIKLDTPELESVYMSDKSQRNVNEMILHIKQVEEVAGTESLTNYRFPQFKPFYEAEMVKVKMQRDEFIKAQKEQMALPPQERTPYLIDNKGNLRPYTEEEIEEFKSERRERRFGLQESDLGDHFSFPDAYDPLIASILEKSPEEAIPNPKLYEVLSQYKNNIDFSDMSVKTGDMFSHQDVFLDEMSHAKSDFREANRSKSLQEFASGHEDFYEKAKQFEKKLNTQKQEEMDLEEEIKKGIRMKDVAMESKESLIDAPTLGKFFEDKSKGKGLYHKFKGTDFEDQAHEDVMDRIREDEYDDDEHTKQLIARMYGGNLSARQWGVLMNMGGDSVEFEKRRLRAKEKAVFDSRIKIRNAEELIEADRRRRVASGEWTEAESHTRVQERIDEISHRFPTEQSMITMQRLIEEKKEFENDQFFDEKRHEREYYFDEGLGQSLNQHIAELKKDFPTMKIQTRRDRDGLPIIKLISKPDFKYDLKYLENLTIEDFKQIENETNEAFMNIFMPSDQKKFVKSVAQQQNFMGGDNELTLSTLQVEELKDAIHQRFFGYYQKDLPGFVSKLEEIKSKKSASSGAATVPGIAFNPSSAEGAQALLDSMMSQLMPEKSIIERDISKQMRMRVNSFLRLSKYDEADLVKPRKSENLMFRDQLNTLDDSIEILQRDNKYLLEEGAAIDGGKQNPEFDLDAYKALKRDLKAQKEKKERVLKSGFPEMKPYLRM